jgi:4-hydroxy-tetrahydrodipicolinate reductase
MTHRLKIVICGASGRMGRRLISLALGDPQLEVVGATVRPASRFLGTDAGELVGVPAIGVPLSDQWPVQAELAVDFSSPEGAIWSTRHCFEQGTPLVQATTGLDPEQWATVERAAERIPLCIAPNTSLAVNLTMQLAELAAKAFRTAPGGVDVEIIERHHRYKEDSPSGTALHFGRLIAQQLGIDQHVHGRHGKTGQRPSGQIGYHAVRAGDDPGQHTILFGMLGECVELRVAASDRDCYAAGALAAAKFLAGKPPGRYHMRDVLGLTNTAD